jgi:hypothetical protein
MVQYSTAKYSTVQHSTTQYSTVQHSTVQLQYSTAQYSTVQHSTYCSCTARHAVSLQLNAATHISINYEDGRTLKLRNAILLPRIFNKFPRFMKPNVHLPVNNSSPRLPIRRQINPVHVLPSYFF